MKENTRKEIAHLEAVAQANYDRANRLSNELNFLRADHLEMKRQVWCSGSFSVAKSVCINAFQETVSPICFFFQMFSQSELTQKEKATEDRLMHLKEEIKSVFIHFHQKKKKKKKHLTI